MIDELGARRLELQFYLFIQSREKEEEKGVDARKVVGKRAKLSQTSTAVWSPREQSTIYGGERRYPYYSKKCYIHI